jgi:beta-glucosidase
MNKPHVAVVVLVLATFVHAAEKDVWKDPSQPIDARVKDLISKMTLEEKASQIQANPPAIPRLGIPAYSHRNECLHGVAHGVATVFPQAIGMAATWDTALIKQEADVIATEGRGKHNDAVAKNNGNTPEHAGVNFYSPNINIFRDPRWGRGQETYGEDPFLTSRIAVAFITGLQGDDPKYVKAMACAKHYAVHSGPEKQRHHFDAKPSERDLYETYLPAFEASVKEAKVGSFMGAYSALYGKPCCADPFLLTEVLRNRWKFDGMVFSDGGAIGDIWAEHKFVPGPEEAAAAAVKAGCDVSSGGMGNVDRARGPASQPGHVNAGIKGGAAFSALPAAVKNGLISEDQVNVALTRELTLRFRLGLFDPPENVPWSKLGMEVVDTSQHRALALKVAQESIVLLKNDGLLPLERGKYKRIAVIGPNADYARMQNGNYTGQASESVTVLEGIRLLAGDGVEVVYEHGCTLAVRRDGADKTQSGESQKALAAAKDADLIVYVGGLDFRLEKEEGNAASDVFEGFSRGDRVTIEFPAVQEDLIKKLHAIGKPMVLVNCSGSAIAMPWEAEHIPAIVQAWYPGEEGGKAVAQVLFGEVNPGGRLPVTFYKSTGDLPPFEDYAMANRTYRYFAGKPLFAFGHGLSYTKFDYADAKLESSTVPTEKTIKLSFKLTNTGQRDGDEVAQVYVRRVDKSAQPQPRQSLCGFARVAVAAGKSSQVAIEIPAERLRRWDTTRMHYVIEPGEYELLIGGASDDIRLHTKIAITDY